MLCGIFLVLATSLSLLPSRQSQSQIIHSFSSFCNRPFPLCCVVGLLWVSVGCPIPVHLLSYPVLSSIKFFWSSIHHHTYERWNIDPILVAKLLWKLLRSGRCRTQEIFDSRVNHLLKNMQEQTTAFTGLGNIVWSKPCSSREQAASTAPLPTLPPSIVQQAA